MNKRNLELENKIVKGGSVNITILSLKFCLDHPKTLL